MTRAPACATLSLQTERGVQQLRASRGITAFGLVLSISIGIVLGTGGFTFYYAEGGSYLSNDPAACINCHIMNEHFSGWQQSAHHHVAVCNDCHAPHDLIGKYATKADAGFRHDADRDAQDQAKRRNASARAQLLHSSFRLQGQRSTGRRSRHGETINARRVAIDG